MTGQSDGGALVDCEGVSLGDELGHNLDLVLGVDVVVRVVLAVGVVGVVLVVLVL
jgi:hypothetical protein